MNCLTCTNHLAQQKIEILTRSQLQKFTEARNSWGRNPHHYNVLIPSPIPGLEFLSENVFWHFLSSQFNYCLCDCHLKCVTFPCFRVVCCAFKDFHGKSAHKIPIFIASLFPPLPCSCCMFLPDTAFYFSTQMAPQGVKNWHHNFSFYLDAHPPPALYFPPPADVSFCKWPQSCRGLSKPQRVGVEFPELPPLLWSGV